MGMAVGGGGVKSPPSWRWEITSPTPRVQSPWNNHVKLTVIFHLHLHCLDCNMGHYLPIGVKLSSRGRSLWLIRSRPHVSEPYAMPSSSTYRTYGWSRTCGGGGGRERGEGERERERKREKERERKREKEREGWGGVCNLF